MIRILALALGLERSQSETGPLGIIDADVTEAAELTAAFKQCSHCLLQDTRVIPTVSDVMSDYI